MPKIKFLGAAGQVTGSCYLVSVGDEQVVIDCGLFQGGKKSYLQNYDEFGFAPDKIDHLILTHAHADHCGRLLLLAKRGFTGAIHAHAATCELAEVILLDSAHIQEVEANWRSRKNRRKRKAKVEPLYLANDAENAIKLFKRHRYHETIKLSDRFSFTFFDAGHILGSSIVKLDVTKDNGEVVKIVFSGDLGRINQPIIKDPEVVESADYLVIESTYGDRNHKDIIETKNELSAILETAAKNNGNIIIPSFAVGRSQEIIYYLRELKDEGRLPAAYHKIYIDSPMAARASSVYEKAIRECYDDEALENIDENQSAFGFDDVKFVSSVEESKKLNMTPRGLLVISASGMCDAGRILHHLKHNLWNENSHIVFVGYQAEGTKGRKIVDGQPVVKIMREEITVKANIHTINALSAHADRDGLTEWAAKISTPPKLTMIVHGELAQAEGLKAKLSDDLGFKCTIPTMGEEIFLLDNYYEN